MKFKLLIVVLLLLQIACKESSWNITSLTNQNFNEEALRKNKLTAIVFLVPGCPLSEAALLELKKLEDQFREKGYETLISIPGNLYDKQEIKAFVDSFEIQFPILLDVDAVLTKKLNATITPEYFLLDSSLNIIYQGAIDNKAFDNEYIRQEASIHYAEKAILEYFSNKKISVSKTKAVGCYIEL